MKDKKFNFDIFFDPKKEDFLKISIFVLTLLLAIVFVLFFSFSGNGQGEKTTATTKQKDSPPVINETLYPYATVPQKESYLALSTGNTKEMALSLFSKNAVLIDAESLEVIAGLGADEAIYPASMTKIMTVLVACDLITDLDDTYLVTKDILMQAPSDASTAYLYAGATVTVEDLLYGISYLSGADAVECLIDYLGIGKAEYVALMNKKATELGLKSTRFGGMIGMDSEENQTTCREMAAILAYALENPLCRELFGGDKHHKPNLDDINYYHGTLASTIEGSMYEKTNTLVYGYNMLCAKSGYEEKALHCLASYIERDDGHGFILVTAGAEKTLDSQGNVVSSGKVNAIKDFITIFNYYEP